RTISATGAGKPKSSRSTMDRPNSEERDHLDRPPVRQEEEPAPESGASPERFQSDDWWRASAPMSDWAAPITNVKSTVVERAQNSGTASVYFCGRTNLFPLNLAIRAIGKENLTGLLRACWDQEPIGVLARDGEIVLATTRDPDLYCPETPSIVVNVDAEVVTNARDEQKENGTPFLLTLARNESIERQAAVDSMRHYGQLLFSRLWSAPNVWIMFEKNADLLGNFSDVTGDPDVDDW